MNGHMQAEPDTEFDVKQTQWPSLSEAVPPGPRRGRNKGLSILQDLFLQKQ